MSKKRILLVGDGNHQFISNYAYWLKKGTSNEITVDILSYKTVKNDHKKHYDNIFTVSEQTIISKIVSKIKGIRRCYRYYSFSKIISKLSKYDFIHFHYVSVDSYYIVKEICKKKSAKIVLSIWGSDMYKVKSLHEKSFIKTCLKADTITFSNEKSIAFFENKYSWNKKNLKLCRFGLAPLENLKELTLSSQECKKQLNWNQKKIAITIGYNSNKAQQHMVILDILDNEKVRIYKDDIQLVLPITYGGSIEYKNELIQKLKQLPYEYFLYDQFLQDAEIAIIRKGTDIMIQLQITDMFSGSMQEHLYARNIVITGSWLPYETMKEYGVWFIEIDNLDQLHVILPEIINKITEYEELTKNNPKAIVELSSWDSNITSWLNLYNN